MKYVYTFNQFPNGKCDPGRLRTEIENSSIIVIQLIDIISSNIVALNFKAELSINEKSELDNIIANHSGEPLYFSIDTIVKVKEEEKTGTQGHFQSRVIDLESQDSSIVIKDISFPYNVSLFSAEWIVADEHVGDRAEFQLGPDTIIGVITEDASIGTNTFKVSQTVIDNIKKGFHVKLNDENLERVIDYDTLNLTITTENSCTSLISSNSYVKMTIKIVPYWKFTASGFNSVGESKIGASFIPANTILRLVYYNENGQTHKKIFGISIDYLY